MPDTKNPKVVIQAGHINHKNNSIVALRGNTGAPGEQELTLRIANRVSGLLRDRGFSVKQTDACANDDKSITSPNNWDLFLSLHGDADTPNDNGGGMVGVPDPKTDGAASESKRIKDIVQANYFKETKIVDKNYTTAGMSGYYMWKYLSAKTPCVLVELGQVQDPHDKVLLANTDLIGNALAKSICIAFGIPFDKPQNPSTPPVDPKDATIADLTKQLDDKNKEINRLNVLIDLNKTNYSTSLSAVEANCQKKGQNIIDKLHSIEDFIKS